MLEFAREQWLWLFLLVAAFYVAWWFARRYRKQRVTYGRIWERVAKRVLPPAWKRILRTVLTLLIGGVLLSAVVLRAAGLQRPESEQIPPKLVVIVIDNSPSMRAVHDGKSRAQMAQERAQQIVDALGENDRAILAYNKEGTALFGRWLKPGEVLGEVPPTDFTMRDARAELVAQVQALEPPPDVPSTPAPQKIAFLLTDSLSGGLPAELVGTTQPATLLSVPTHVETFGAPALNHGVLVTRYEPPAPEEGHGGRLTAGALEFGKVLRAGPALVTANGVELKVDGNACVLPRGPEPQEIRISTGKTDALPQDDVLRMTLNPQGLSRVTLCSPPGADAEREATEALLREMLPGRSLEVWTGGEVETDLLVCDRVVPPRFSARYVLCFGALPAEYGSVGAPLDARPGLRLATSPPAELGFGLPDLSLVWSLEARPLDDGHKLAPLVRNMGGETLVAVKRGRPEVLYCGFIPTLSTLMEDRNGLLLLLRWLAVIQGAGREPIPPFVMAGLETYFKLDQPAKLHVKLADSPWLPAHGAREFELTTGADGRGKLGPFSIPGEYVVTRDGVEIGRFTAMWNNPIVQALPFEPMPATDLAALFGVQREADWRDYLPGLLLWIALGLLVLEWLLWLLGVTE